MLELTIEFGMYGMHAKPLPGARWRASFYDRERGQFYAGSADCPWEAIGWALVEREQRPLLGVVMTKDPRETPLQALERLRSKHT